MDKSKRKQLFYLATNKDTEKWPYEKCAGHLTKCVGFFLFDFNLRNILTIFNSLDTKQSPYRILFRRVNGTNLQVAVAETEKKAEIAWGWIECKI